MPTIGRTRDLPPIEPKYCASPKEKTPPSVDTSQYPPPSGVEAMPTAGEVSPAPPGEPGRYGRTDDHEKSSCGLPDVSTSSSAQLGLPCHAFASMASPSTHGLQFRLMRTLSRCPQQPDWLDWVQSMFDEPRPSSYIQ